MAWRPLPKGASRSDRSAKKEALQATVRRGTPVGILGYLDGEPAAWCSIAPRDSYRDLGGRAGGRGSVWSIACFFVPRRLRGKGMTRQLIAAAVEHARRMGAAVIEGLSRRARLAEGRWVVAAPSPSRLLPHPEPESLNHV